MSAQTEIKDRQRWMSIVAKAPPARLRELMGDVAPHEVLRQPEVGTVMVRARTGGTGAPFNLGEMSVTRCTLRLSCGTVGHGYVQGRDKTHALCAAVVDALMQTREAARIEAQVLTPLEREAGARKSDRAQKAAATKVEFFTMVRGDV